MLKFISQFILISLIVSVLFIFNLNTAVEANEEEVKRTIESHNQEIAKLEEEIKQYESRINLTRAEQNSLEDKINQIDLIRRKLNTDISLTEKKIDNTELTIDRLRRDMAQTRGKIKRHQDTVASSLQRLHWLEEESTNIFTMLLSQENWSDILASMDQLFQVQDSLHGQMAELRETQERLAKTEKENQAEIEKQASLIGQLDAQRIIADSQRQEQEYLLTQTQKEEASYQAILVDRREKKRQVEQEIFLAEQKLEANIDPNQIPSPGPILAWPLDNVRITQYFGNTPFATSNPQVYSGRGHNGIDLGASVGTPLKSSLRGQVIGTGDTDLTCRGASYGKWILIEHPNGLSTLYAHLSLISVKEGQTVGTGEIIGYTGNTGYSTGPHLHFTVYASGGVEVGHLQSQVPGCGVYRLPLGSHSSYMNPLSYLTSLNGQ